MAPPKSATSTKDATKLAIVSSSSISPASRRVFDDHLLDFAAIQQRYSTSFNPACPLESHGLSASEAIKRLQENGPNVLTPPKKKSPIALYLECMGFFNTLLLVCGIAEFIVYGVSSDEGITVVLIVANLNASIEFFQLLASQKALEGFLNMIPASCQVIRDGEIVAIPANQLVLGDVVSFRMGAKVPADVYIIQSADLKVDNSSLTGESEPQERTVENTMQNPLEATNLAFFSTLAVEGEAVGVVIRTGDSTVLGQIAGEIRCILVLDIEGAQGAESNEYRVSAIIPVIRSTCGANFHVNRMGNFIASLATISITVAIIFFGIAIHKTGDVGFALNFAIGILVAFVPQGLPATITMLLTIAAKRMSAKNVLVKELRGVETLGAITLLATDKTGTLTRNQMTVTNFWCGGKLYSANPHNLPPDELQFNIEACGINEILHISAMCSRARFDQTDVIVENRTITGDATESGLLRFAGKKLLDIDQLGHKYQKVLEIPFNSENKWHLAIHQKAHKDGHLTLSMKGAPERVLRVCSYILIDNVAVELNENHKEDFMRSYEYLAGKGHRVIAFAQLLLPGSQYPKDTVFTKDPKNFPTTGLCFVGLASLEDPPKHGVREAVGHCRGAGIKIMMVTGDHPLTAEAVGRKINLMVTDTKELRAKKAGLSIDKVPERDIKAIVIHGEKIDSLTDGDWDLIFSKEEIIFARTSPKNKLQIVKRAQALGHIVGVTGDGVNDSPALKKADLGIAMNISGSDVSKEAASMILLDDNFASTVNGIREGRLIFANLKKSIQYLLSHVLPELLPFLLWAIVPLPSMINSQQLLVVDLGFELFAALSYAWEPAESEHIMKLEPRRPVTVESSERFVKRQAEIAEDCGMDPDSKEFHSRPLAQRIKDSIRMFFTPRSWKRKFSKVDGETLVDTNLMIYSYLQVGIIEFIGCTTAFFVVLYHNYNITPWDARNMMAMDANAFTRRATNSYTTAGGTLLTVDDQVKALAEGNSIFYFCLMIQQCFNLFASKCKLGLPMGKYMFANPKTFFSVLAGALFGAFIVYTPGVQTVFLTASVSPIFWLIGLGYGIFLVLFVAVRQVIIRTCKDGAKKDAAASEAADKLQKTTLELDILLRALEHTNTTAERLKSANGEQRNEIARLVSELDEKRADRIDVTADMARQYKCMQSEMMSKINALEAQVEDLKVKLAITQNASQEAAKEYLQIIATKDEVIEEQNVKMSYMSAEFESMLNETLAKMSRKLEIVSARWKENDNMQLSDGNSRKLADFHLHRLIAKHTQADE
ncbi:hypothetical protein HDU82_003855 [Entophlyctis luteolus]|nr:hypothetical protein HDU82_003855 [Entophlyctis luteolus]